MSEKCLGYLNSINYVNESSRSKKWKINKLNELGLDSFIIMHMKEKVIGKEVAQSHQYGEKYLLEKCALDDDLMKFYSAINPTTSWESELKNLPISAYLLKIEFTLARPFFSRDDDDLFYFVPNPIVKETVFKIPMVRPTTWKGKMRWVGMKLITNILMSQGELDKSIVDQVIQIRMQLIRLFGNETRTEKEYLDKYFSEADILKYYENQLKQLQLVDDSGNRKGYLNFFATYFNKISYEITNKLDDAKRTGQKPIKYEVVPDGTQGTFMLLYLPFDEGYSISDQKVFFDDLELVRLILHDMFFVFGFSAKGEYWGTIYNNPQIKIFTPKQIWTDNLSLCKKYFGGAFFV